MDVKWRTRDVLSLKTLEKSVKKQKIVVYDRWFNDQRDKGCNDKRAAAFFLHQTSKPALYASSEGELLRRPTASGVVILPTKLSSPSPFQTQKDRERTLGDETGETAASLLKHEDCCLEKRSICTLLMCCCELPSVPSRHLICCCPSPASSKCFKVSGCLIGSKTTRESLWMCDVCICVF